MLHYMGHNYPLVSIIGLSKSGKFITETPAAQNQTLSLHLSDDFNKFANSLHKNFDSNK